MSIKRKLFLGISAFIIGFVVIAFAGFITYMPDIVEHAKQDEMRKVAQNLIAMETELDIDTYILDVSNATDISIIFDGEVGNASTGNQRGRGMGRNFSEGLGSIIQEAGGAPSSSFFVVEHRALNTPYMIYKDETEDGKSFYVMRPLQSIDDVVDVTKEFFAIVAAFAVVLGLAFSYIYSRRFVDPILKLNDMAKYMAKLDFSHVYKGQNKDEIGELGSSINHLSSQLNTALTELEEELNHKEKLNDLQKRFLADASHELKTPLAIIMGNVEQLEDIALETPQGGKYYRTIINELEHMNRIIQDLLRLSELESADSAMNIAEIDLASIIDDVLFSFSEMIKQKKVNLEYDLPDTLPILADEKYMSTVMRNIISNALKHSSNGALIKIYTEMQGNDTKLCIFNASKPIPNDQLENMFERFSKYTEVGNPSDSKSTGLGLAIVKRILELHDMEFRLENVEAGVRFSLTFSTRS